LKFRRAKPLACYWNGGRLIARNYYTGRQSLLPSLAADILSYCGAWRSTAEICARFDAFPAASIRSLLTLLTKLTLLERGPHAAADPFDEWAEWMPEGAFFHFASKNVHYVDAEVMRGKLQSKARRIPPPPPLKRYDRARAVALPAPDESFALADVLRRRRTWRRFAEGSSLPLVHVSTLLGLTWGVQSWVKTRFGPFALKTSPSGGGRHPIEAYLLARRVDGLAPAWYHYDPDRHALQLVRRGARASTPDVYLPRQTAFREAPALFVMTAIFARTQWAYRPSRAYRVVLLDAGHLGQTFCLVATALGLAPFSSAALADSRIEQDLRLDGIRESVIYACGVGVRPAGVEWALWPDSRRIPDLIAPASRKSSQPSLGRTRKKCD
jgi:SagB-type dehydrogenase family enzyme